MTDIRQLQMDELRLAVAAGVSDALTSVISDDKFVRQFWHRGYEELAAHSGAGASQWIGKRLLTGLVIAAVLAGIAWLIRNGAFK